MSIEVETLSHHIQTFQFVGKAKGPIHHDFHSNAFLELQFLNYDYMVMVVISQISLNSSKSLGARRVLKAVSYGHFVMHLFD